MPSKCTSNRYIFTSIFYRSVEQEHFRYKCDNWFLFAKLGFLMHVCKFYFCVLEWIRFVFFVNFLQSTFL